MDVPDLGMPLDEVAHPVVVAAQMVPKQRDAGGAERVLSLADRVWFKVKTGDQRAVVTHLSRVERPEDLPDRVGAWWLGAAGRRQNDSPQRDFYASIQRESTTGRTVSTTYLLPVDWDWKRLRGEGAVAWRRTMRRLVIHLIAMSMTSGGVAVAEFRAHRIKALVRADDGGEAYLAIIAEGIPDPAVFALLLDCVPGVAADDWQPEPSEIAGMNPEPGEIVWSTLLPTDVASTILGLDAGWDSPGTLTAVRPSALFGAARLAEHANASISTGTSTTRPEPRSTSAATSSSSAPQPSPWARSATERGGFPKLAASRSPQTRASPGDTQWLSMPSTATATR